MEERILIIAALKKHRTSFFGVFILIFIVSTVLSTVLTIWNNSNQYIRSEMERAGFGQLTVWAANISEPQQIVDEINSLQYIEQVNTQKIIYSNYEINGQESDSEGQLILFQSKENRYRFFEDGLSSHSSEEPIIAPGEVYVSPSMISMFGIAPGDEIIFPIVRNGGNVSLTVRGFYEDPFMGSSMIGMKGFLISETDYSAIQELIENAGIDGLARTGAMFHIHIDNNSAVPAAELNRLLVENTELSKYIEFVHSADAISGFMLILQVAFCSMFIAFALVLLFATFIVLGHSLSSTIEADYVNMGILKTLGFTGRKLRNIQLLQYSLPVLSGMVLGVAFSYPLSILVSTATLTTTGILIPSVLPMVLCLVCFMLVLASVFGFIALKTQRINRISPMKAIRNESNSVVTHFPRAIQINGKRLSFTLAVRQLMTGKKKYISACLVAILLVFFASMVGRMDSWLGSDGKGMMDAFNPADHDIGVQIFGDFEIEDAESVITSYTEITDSYLLAMPSVSVNGKNYSANVITEPERFHIIEGNTSMNDNEVVLTEFAAADLGLSIGDTLFIVGDLGQDEYIVSGIYSCANDMGDNIGMSREGYLKIGEDDSRLWCYHYFLANPLQKEIITSELEKIYGGDVHVHENTWPGLFGIISAMQGLIILMYGMTLVFILVVTMMTGSKILAAEQRDLGIYKAIGLTTNRLRLSFAFRFSVVAIIGAAFGTVLAAMLTDLLVSTVMKLAGISNFASNPGIGQILLPGCVVILFFTVFAYFAAGRISKVNLRRLITE